MSEDPAGPSGVRAGDADREATVTRLQTALGEGRISLQEFGDRASVAYAATTTAELDALLADLPAPASEVPAVGEIVGERTTAEPLFSVFGDVKLAATTAVPRQVGTLFGDVKIDLRGLRTSPARYVKRPGDRRGRRDATRALGPSTHGGPTGTS